VPFLGVRELACLLLVFVFLIFSPILHISLIGLEAFLVAHIANHSCSLIKLLHCLDGVILMRLGLLCLVLPFTWLKSMVSVDDGYLP
jgi:hypothetical protein